MYSLNLWKEVFEDLNVFFGIGNLEICYLDLGIFFLETFGVQLVLVIAFSRWRRFCFIYLFEIRGVPFGILVSLLFYGTLV